MKQIIQKIYETGTVIGQSGEVHKLHSEIDRHEGEFLFDIINNDSQILKTLEVGCGYGLSSLFICLATRERAGASHTIIDPFQKTLFDGAGIRNLEEAGIDYFHLIEVKSEFALPRLLEEKEGEFDFIFIDGFHTFDHTLLDCFYGTRLLRVGGYLAIDDVSFPSIKRVVDFLKNYPCYEKYGSVNYNASKSWKKIIARILASPTPRRTWVKVLKPSLYRRIFEDRVTRMIALKKIEEDIRNWDWHDDAF
ncbi:MAG: class I SAM-dependent methyltransferase [Candidatus Scalinduaceae bacterium]